MCCTAETLRKSWSVRIVCESELISAVCLWDLNPGSYFCFREVTYQKLFHSTKASTNLVSQIATDSNRVHYNNILMSSFIFKKLVAFMKIQINFSESMEIISHQVLEGREFMVFLEVSTGTEIFKAPHIWWLLTAPKVHIFEKRINFGLTRKKNQWRDLRGVRVWRSN